ncbi:MAG: hypothetical protein IPM71_08580 [Bacteroidota bacterium]|nr:MAG: hypothetical protein IPM71_08580 [Bacteroidota bacterium]
MFILRNISSLKHLQLLKLPLLIPVFIIGLVPVSAQLTKQPEKLTTWNEKYQAGMPRVSIAAMPAYTPEHQFSAATALLISFKTKRNNNYLNHSSLPLEYVTNFNQNHSFWGQLNSFWYDNLIKFEVEANLQNRQDHYWGVGMTDAMNEAKNESTTQYYKNYGQICPAIGVRLIENLYAGIGYNFNQTKATNLSPALSEDTYIISQGSQILNTGIGFLLDYKIEDIGNKPNHNLQFKSTFNLYSDSKQGDFTYQKLIISYLHSIPLEILSSRLNWNLNVENNFGDVPWTDMAMLGGARQMMGLAEGKYREKNLVQAWLQYNYVFNSQINQTVHRHEAIVRFGGGTVYSDASVSYTIFNFVVGYRFRYQPDYNLKLDFAFADGSFGSYVGFEQRF